MTGPPAVEAEELSFGYRRGQEIVRGVSLRVAAGEVVGLLGRNGSGKTTILRLLAGLLRPDAGRVRVDAPAVRRAVVLDRTPFLDALDGLENLRTALALRGWSGSAAAESAGRGLEAFGLAVAARRPVGEYSLGMRRRLALAEAFAADPALLLLDEPTLGLDPEGRATLVERLRGAASAGASAVVATNDAAFAERACDRVLVLFRGAVAAAGCPEALVAALDAPTVIHLELTSGPPATDPPTGFEVIASGARSMTLRGRGAGVGALWRWFEAEDVRPRALRIREPGLADVFAASTGVALEPNETETSS